MATASAGAAIAATLLRHLTLESYAETGRELERFLGAEGFSLLSPLLEFFERTVPRASWPRSSSATTASSATAGPGVA